MRVPERPANGARIREDAELRVGKGFELDQLPIGSSAHDFRCRQPSRLASLEDGLSLLQLDAPRFKRKFPAAVLTRSFDYGAEMRIPMKDIDLAIAQGEELGVPMWVCEAARLVFKHAMHKGAAKEDLTAIVKYVERDAGFEIPKTR